MNYVLSTYQKLPEKKRHVFIYTLEYINTEFQCNSVFLSAEIDTYASINPSSLLQMQIPDLCVLNLASGFQNPDSTSPIASVYNCINLSYYSLSAA